MVEDRSGLQHHDKSSEIKNVAPGGATLQAEWDGAELVGGPFDLLPGGWCSSRAVCTVKSSRSPAVLDAVGVDPFVCETVGKAGSPLVMPVLRFAWAG